MSTTVLRSFDLTTSLVESHLGHLSILWVTDLPVGVKTYLRDTGVAVLPSGLLERWNDEHAPAPCAPLLALLPPPSPQRPVEERVVRRR